MYTFVMIILIIYVHTYSEDFASEVNLDSFMQTMLTTGFQATNVGLAINEINRMVIFISTTSTINYY